MQGLYASGQSLRIESGFRAFGHELTPWHHPARGRPWQNSAPSARVLWVNHALKDHVSAKRQIVSLLFDDPEAIPIHDEPDLF